MSVGHNRPPMPAGWIAVHRNIRTHHIVGYGKPVKPCDPSRGAYSRSEAWQDLLMECRYQDGTVLNGGREMEIRRGELVGAISWLAARWNWTPKTVRGFIDALEADGAISVRAPGAIQGQQKGKQAHVISVCNYEKYQSAPDDEGQAKGPDLGTQKASNGQATGNILRKDNKDNNNTPISARAVDRASQDRGKDYWSKAMEVPGAYNPSEGVFRDPGTGVLQLVNGVRALWVERFGGDEQALDLALIQAAPYVKPNGAHPVRTQVEAQLAKQLSWKAERDKKSSKPTPASTSLAARIRAFNERQENKGEG